MISGLPQPAMGTMDAIGAMGVGMPNLGTTTTTTAAASSSSSIDPRAPAQATGHDTWYTHHLQPSLIEPTASSSSSSVSPPQSAPFSGLAEPPAAAHGGGGVGKWQKEGPVKNACLSCRSKKAKCDGARPACTQCRKKEIDCVYVKSRRGGARKKREVVAPSALQEFLKKLDGLLAVPEFKPLVADIPEDTTNIIRRFSSRDEILRCYYNEVHPFLTVMPPRQYIGDVLPSLLPDSPFLLAAQTILTLVPNGNDPSPNSPNSKHTRRVAAEELNKRTMALVESLLSNEQARLECVQALSMLSLYEWGSSGSPALARERSAQAVQIALDMGLHEMDKYATPSSGVIFGDHSQSRSIEGVDWRRDMARRTWWMAYTHQLMAAIVSGTAPVMPADDPRIRVDYPVCSVNDHAWPNWVETVQKCHSVFALVNTAYFSTDHQSAAWGERPMEVQNEEKIKLRRDMLEMDRQIMEMMKEAERTSIIELVPGGEAEVARNQQLSAMLGLAVLHLHIHRHQAFPEVSLFSKRICGLPQMPDPTEAPLRASENVDTSVVANPPPSLSYADTSNAMLISAQNGNGTGKPIQPTDEFGMDFTDDYIEDEMWQPDTYPENLPAPWFARYGGASSLYAATEQEPHHAPAMTPRQSASIVPISPSNPSEGRRESGPSPSPLGSKPHRAWGVDDKDQVLPLNRRLHTPSPAPGPSAAFVPNMAGQPPEVVEIELDPDSRDIFPPGISLARCATAAHTIVRLEVLHRSAVIAMCEGPPRWMPFCSCGLVTGAYAFLLLALAVQAENMQDPTESRQDEVDALLTNVKVIVAGLEAYGQMWAGIEVMAGEVRAALEAASKLPYEIRAQIEAASTASQVSIPTPSSHRGSYPDPVQVDFGQEFVQTGDWSMSGGGPQ